MTSERAPDSQLIVMDAATYWYLIAVQAAAGRALELAAADHVTAQGWADAVLGIRRVLAAALGEEA